MTSPCSMRSAPAKQRNPRSSYASKPWDFHSPKLGLAMGHCMGGGQKTVFILMSMARSRIRMRRL